MLDPAPRVVLDPDYGLITVGRTPSRREIVEDIYRHTIDVILRATALGGYRAAARRRHFRRGILGTGTGEAARQGKAPRASRAKSALVTGAASGIGKACVESLLARGAAVDRAGHQPGDHDAVPAPGLSRRALRRDRRSADLAAALEAGVRRFGGLDMLVLNAGIFPPGTPIAALKLADWDRVMRVNLDANLSLDARSASAAQSSRRAAAES